jgi:anti-sigma B factor antagonist
MDMAIQDQDGVTRIVLVGKLDIMGAEQIDLKFSAIASARPRVGIDLTGVDYIASMGIRTLVMSGRAAALRGNKIVIFGACDTVRKVITTSGLDEIIPLAEDWDEARAVLG